MNHTTLKRANFLTDEANRIGNIVELLGYKLEVGSEDNSDFSNVIISAVPMGDIKVPEQLVEKILEDIRNLYRKEWDQITDELESL
jgi:phospholipid N-methyltransferase